MQEPQYSEQQVRDLMRRIAVSRATSLHYEYAAVAISAPH